MTPEDLKHYKARCNPRSGAYNAAFALDVYRFGLKEAVRMQDEQDYLSDYLYENDLLERDPEDKKPKKQPQHLIDP